MPKKKPKTALEYIVESCKTFIPEFRVSKKGNVYFRCVLLCTKCDSQLHEVCRLRSMAESPALFEMK